MSYNELIGLVRETNRPPGGIDTLMAIARACFLGHGRSVLEIGTATGFTALTLAGLTGATVTAIDINLESLREAEARAIAVKLDHRVRFFQQDATTLTFEDETFDVVLCGNVTSLIADRAAALSEYRRVLRPGGILAAVPMYYVESPAQELVDQVRAAIQVDFEPHDRAYWLRFFESGDFAALDAIDFRFDRVSEQHVDRHCEIILGRSHLQELDYGSRTALSEVYSRYMQLFRVNLSHMGYTIVTLQKLFPHEDRELFFGHRL